MNEYAQTLQQLGERIRLHRVARGDSVAQMAERLQCAPNTYAALEHGNGKVSLELLVKTLALLGLLDGLQQLAPLSLALLSQPGKKRAKRKSAILPNKQELDF